MHQGKKKKDKSRVLLPKENPSAEEEDIDDTKKDDKTAEDSKVEKGFHKAIMGIEDGKGRIVPIEGEDIRKRNPIIAKDKVVGIGKHRQGTKEDILP